MARRITAGAIAALALALWADIIRPGAVSLRLTPSHPVSSALAD